MCQRELADIDSVGIVGLEREFLDGLLEVSARRSEGQRILVLFLGSTIGNFSSPADRKFLVDIRTILRAGRRSPAGDRSGETPSSTSRCLRRSVGRYEQAFNLNLLARINRELEGHFDLSQFEHVARFNSETGSIEMHLRSKRRQTVVIRKANLRPLSNKARQSGLRTVTSTRWPR